MLSVGYQESDPVYQGDRDFSVLPGQSYTGGQAGSGTAVPSRFSGTAALDRGTCTPNTTTPDGRTPLATGVSQVEWRDGQVCQGGSIANNYAPFNFNPYNVFQTPFTRYNIFGQAHYEVSDAVEVTAAACSRRTM